MYTTQLMHWRGAGRHGGKFGEYMAFGSLSLTFFFSLALLILGPLSNSPRPPHSRPDKDFALSQTTKMPILSQQYHRSLYQRREQIRRRAISLPLPWLVRSGALRGLYAQEQSRAQSSFFLCCEMEKEAWVEVAEHPFSELPVERDYSPGGLTMGVHYSTRGF